MLQTRLTWHVTIHKFSSDGPPRTLVVKRTLIHHSSLNCYFEKLYFSIRLKQIITRVLQTISISSIACQKDTIKKRCSFRMMKFKMMQFHHHAISIFRCFEWCNFKNNAVSKKMHFQKRCIFKNMPFQKNAISKMMRFQKLYNSKKMQFSKMMHNQQLCNFQKYAVFKNDAILKTFNDKISIIKWVQPKTNLEKRCILKWCCQIKVRFLERLVFNLKNISKIKDTKLWRYARVEIFQNSRMRF